MDLLQLNIGPLFAAIVVVVWVRRISGRLLLVSAMALLALGCASAPPAATGIPTASADVAGGEPATGTIVSIRPVASSPALNGRAAIEIEVRSDRIFPVRNEIVVLRVGAHEYLLSRYPPDGDLHTLIFTLTAEEFGSTVDGDPVVVQYGRGESSDRWDLGHLRKPSSLSSPRLARVR